MGSEKKEYHWKKQTVSPQCDTIECPELDPVKDFRRDPSGHYVLIRVDRAAGKLEVAVCDPKHTIVKIFRGKTCQDVYEGIFRFEEKHKCAWFMSKGHAAYLGKELKKAELALAGPGDYIQE